MDVKKVVSVLAYTTDGKVLTEGNKYVFDIAEGKCMTGIFNGFTSKGALKFTSVIADPLVQFNIMPTSILSIYEAEIEVKGNK